MPTNDFIDRVSSADPGYRAGDLSLYPASIDTQKILFQARNNAETALKQTVGYASRTLIAEDTSLFPPQGLIRLGEEFVYYDEKTNSQFRRLKRGFAGSRQSQWAAGTKIVNAVFAEPHNAIKDALLNIEVNLGTNTPTPTSLNGILKNLEKRYLSPKPIFRAAPLKGAPPLTVSFQNFSGGEPVRYLWDFGDGSTSILAAPTHTYLAEGHYTVKLNMITSLGAQGITVKTEYVQVSESFGPRFFYVTPQAGSVDQEIQFVDQTVGNVMSRNWIFGDGDREQQDDPDIHFTSHAYSLSGEYKPTLIVIFRDQSLITLQLPDPIIIS